MISSYTQTGTILNNNVNLVCYDLIVKCFENIFVLITILRESGWCWVINKYEFNACLYLIASEASAVQFIDLQHTTAWTDGKYVLFLKNISWNKKHYDTCPGQSRTQFVNSVL